jgi:hypothetical protein
MFDKLSPVEVEGQRQIAEIWMPRLEQARKQFDDGRPPRKRLFHAHR